MLRFIGEDGEMSYKTMLLHGSVTNQAATKEGKTVKI
jgi:hypothetical protein